VYLHNNPNCGACDVTCQGSQVCCIPIGGGAIVYSCNDPSACINL
jgi:hypothetical protein